MRLAIIGSGPLARTLAHRLRGAGHDVATVEKPDPDTLTSTLEDIDAVSLALPYKRALQLPPDPFGDKVVIDATDYYPQDDGPIADLDKGRTTSSELLAEHLAEARVVKAFNTIGLEALGAVGLLAADLDPVAIPLAGDHQGAKATVAELIVDLGFVPVDAGSLKEGWRMQPGTPAHGLVSNEVGVRRALESA